MRPLRRVIEAGPISTGLHPHTTVYWQSGAVDKLGAVRSEEDDGVGDVLGCGQAPGRCPADDGGHGFLDGGEKAEARDVVGKAYTHLVCYQAGIDAVDAATW